MKQRHNKIWTRSLHGSMAKTLGLGLLCCLLMVLAPARGQNANLITMPVYGSQTVTLSPGVTYTLYDPGGTNPYPAECNSQISFMVDCGQDIFIEGDFNCTGCSSLYLYGMGFSITYHNIPTEIGYSGHMQYHISGNRAILTFSNNNPAVNSGFELTVKACCTSVYNVVANQNEGPGTLSLSWSDSSGATEWYIESGINENSPTRFDTVHTTHVTLTGLTGATDYWYHIGNNNHDCTSTTVFTPYQSFWLECLPYSGSCIDITQTGSCSSYYYWGLIGNPHQHNTRLDLGSDNTNSRHTVHTTLDYDLRTNYQLRTIPVGYSTSARIGGTTTGGYTEGVSYLMHVDTMNYDLIIMRYAALMQNPSHPYEQQPKFTFQILDSLGDTLGNPCYQAIFISSNDLGWNQGQGQWLWKDWTTVGFDLGALHEQDIYVNLQTYDCTQSGHSAYAYYVLECGRKQLVSSECGDVDSNTFTAPEGFAYRWYNANAPAVTLGTGRTLHVADSGIYHCVCSYTTSNNTNCSFTLTAVAGHRWPAAIASWETVGYDDCNTLVRLRDLSVVSTDQQHNNLTDYPCEASLWRIDDDFESTEANPIVPLSAGEHYVTLFASLSGGNCVDSVSFVVTIPSFTIFDTVAVNVCDDVLPYAMFDSLFYASGTYNIIHDCHHRQLQLTINPTYSVVYYDTVNENSLPYHLGDRTFYDNVTDERVTLASQRRCDSIVFLNLYVRPNDTVIIDTVICDDALPLSWLGSVFTHAGTVSYAETNIHGGDSIIFKTLYVNPTHQFYDTVVVCQGDSLGFEYAQTGDYHIQQLTTLGCDSTTHLHLIVNPSYHLLTIDTICSNQSYPWYGDSITTAGEYHSQQLTTMGCDSNETLRLFVKPAYSNTDIVRICNGRPYTWRDGITYTESTNLPRIVYDANGCDSLFLLDLIISSNFHAAMNIRPQLVDYYNQDVTLRDESGGRTRQWHYMGLMDTTDIVYFTYPLELDSVEVMLIAVSHDDCADTAFGLIRPDRAVLWAPNVFTPDENQNRQFLIQSNELLTATVWVYDRGGNLMATFDALTGSWDGTCHGKPCKQAAYVWVMRYTTLAHPRQEKTAKGTVLLLR